MKRIGTALALASLLGACTVGPNYRRPAAAGVTPAAWKADPGWRPARPGDRAPRPNWWAAFGDPVLDDLEARVPRANQDVAAALAALDQARGFVRETRAGLFPTVELTGGVTRTVSGGGNVVVSDGTVVGGGTGTGTGGTTTSGGTRRTARIRLGADASWTPDLFGRVRRGVESARAQADAAAADLANVQLVAQGTLANDYLQLRALDRQAELYEATVQAYRRALQITTNRYNAGVSAKSDVLQADAQLQVALANRTDIDRQRASFENAIAVLVGENPSSFTLVRRGWRPVAPLVPALVPSELTERRPDVAAAERRVASANAQIGVQVAAFFPDITLSASGSTQASSIGALFGASANLWSVGVSAIQTILDFGARRARVQQARAAWRQTVAQYRSTALNAFADVEDQLAAANVLRVEEGQRLAASRSADQSEAIAFNQYKAGQIAYTDVITQQTAALSARLNLVAATRDRQLAAVGLAQALGGGWSGLETRAAR